MEDALILILWLGDDDCPTVRKLHHSVIVTTRVEVNAITLPFVPTQKKQERIDLIILETMNRICCGSKCQREHTYDDNIAK